MHIASDKPSRSTIFSTGRDQSQSRDARILAAQSPATHGGASHSRKSVSERLKPWISRGDAEARRRPALTVELGFLCATASPRETVVPQFTRFHTGSPRTAARAIRAEVLRISTMPSGLQNAAWQVTIRFGVAASSFVRSGSASTTSSPAPAR